MIRRSRINDCDRLSWLLVRFWAYYCRIYQPRDSITGGVGHLVDWPHSTVDTWRLWLACSRDVDSVQRQQTARLFTALNTGVTHGSGQPRVGLSPF